MADDKSDAVAVAWLGLAKAVLWPAIAGIVLVAYHGPAYAILSGLADNLRSAQTIDLGYVKITSRDLKLAPPSQRVKEALGKLDRPELQALFEQAADSGTSVCDAPSEPWAVARKKKYDKLVSDGLFEYRDQNNTSRDGCGTDKIVWFSDMGKEVKDYLQRIIFDQITLSPSEERSSEH